MTVTEERTYSTREVSMLTGLTKRQLDYWMRCRVLGSLGLEMPGSGGKIAWRESHLPVLRVLHALVSLGAGHSVLRRVADEWTELDTSQRWLVVDDEDLLVADDQLLAQLVSTMAPGVRVVDLDRVVRGQEVRWRAS